MNKILALSLALLLVGCSHQLSLHPRDGGAVATGVAQEAGQTVEIVLQGNVYKGKYTHDGGSIATFQSFGTSTAIGRPTTFVGSSFGTAYVPGSGNGRIFATSPSGDALRCEFQYKTGGGLGVCENNKGQLFDLVIHN